MTLRRLMKRLASVKAEEEELQAGGDTAGTTETAQQDEVEARLGEAGLGQYPQYHQYHQYPQYQAPRAVSRWDSEDHFNLHWTVRATAFIATFFKVGSILLAVMSVLALSYLGIMISWGLAFGLPWILAYFYFIWICPAHQLSMGIRKLKPHRMVWWVVSGSVHILLVSAMIVSATLLHSFPSLHLQDNLSLLAAFLIMLLLFEMTVIYAIFIIHKERKRLEAEESPDHCSPSSHSCLQSSPPPPYNEVYCDQETLPPKYEDIVQLPATATTTPTTTTTTTTTSDQDDGDGSASNAPNSEIE